VQLLIAGESIAELLAFKATLRLRNYPTLKGHRRTTIPQCSLYPLPWTIFWETLIA